MRIAHLIFSVGWVENKEICFNCIEIIFVKQSKNVFYDHDIKNA